ncbi:MAG: YbhB/YbcL family Raf kinase inhibitor-like protein [Gammaproteobacteria bacterium]|nr:YbhB/YbcL family Raf kinase inhibitor-like protein [Gammaproteobacteria bacterium]
MGFALSDIQLSSTAFEHSGVIPTRHTGEGEDVSPALCWDNVPDGTQAFAVICHDPDAPLVTSQGAYGFVHWVLYNIPGMITSLAEGCDQFTQGKNDFGKQGYGGPMPPNGHGQHRYYFWVLALKDDSELDCGLTMGELLAQIESQLIGMNRLCGVYQRD